MKYYSQYNNLFVCPICGTRFVCNDRDAWAYKLGRNTPWNFSLVAVNNILITDQISKKTIGNIRYENIAGIYTENKNRIKKYEDGEDGE